MTRGIFYGSVTLQSEMCTYLVPQETFRNKQISHMEIVFDLGI